MKVIRRSPNKFWVFIGGKAFVIRLEREVSLIPRWRIAGALLVSSLFAGAAFALNGIWQGATMLGIALICLWAASR